MKRYTFVLSAILLIAALFLTGADGFNSGFDPHVSHFFEVEIDGLVTGRFSEVEGLGIGQEVVEIQEEGDPLIHKRPGVVRYNDITLRRGYVPGSDLNNWIEEARSGGGENPFKKVSIILYQISKDGKTEKEVRRWTCMSAFPKSWRITSLDGKENDVLTEEMVVVIDYFEES